MRRPLLFCALLLTLIGAAEAADITDPLPRYERAGAGFGCHVEKADFDKATALHWSADQACMRIGPLYVGAQRTEVETLLGTSNQSVVTNGHENFVYAVHRDDARNVTAYAVVTYAPDGTADSIQLTGQAWPDAWRFSGLTLGDSDDALRARLGEPMQTLPSEEAGTLVWSYRPWTFSIEVHDRKISSIRAAKSDG